MNDTEYLKQMIALTEELNRAASAEPFDKDDWQSALDEFHRVNQVWYHSRRVHPWLINFVIIAAIVFVAYLFYLLLCEASI